MPPKFTCYISAAVSACLYNDDPPAFEEGSLPPPYSVDDLERSHHFLNESIHSADPPPSYTPRALSGELELRRRTLISPFWNAEELSTLSHDWDDDNSEPDSGPTFEERLSDVLRYGFARLESVASRISSDYFSALSRMHTNDAALTEVALIDHGF